MENFKRVYTRFIFLLISVLRGGFLNEYLVTMSLKDVPVGYWSMFKSMMMQQRIYNDMVAKLAVDIFFKDYMYIYN